ncbi:MAG: ABC transporter substrate-binding protein [Angustibacter sp.]
MFRRSTRAALALAGAAALAMSACGSDSLSGSGNSPTGSVSSAAQDAILADKLPSSIASVKKIVVGTDASYAPSQFLAGDGKTIQGFDVDLFNAVAQKFGVTVEWQNAKFDSIIAGVQSGKYDMGISSFTINSDRKKQVTMVSYFNAGTQWATQQGNPKNVDPDNACGLTVAVQTGTVQQEEDLPKRQAACKEAGEPAIKVLSYEGQDEATAAVASKKADAMLADSPVGAYAVKLSSGALELVGEVYDAAPYGYVLPSDQGDFATAITEALKALQADGTYTQVLEKWGVQEGGITDFAVNP